MADRAKIPRPTIKRLSLYLRELEAFGEANRSTISSRQLGDALGLTDAQVRKDLAYFGQFGHPGIGYRTRDLRDELRRILGTDRTWPTVVVGAGNIGRAISSYGRLAAKGFAIRSIVDEDPAVVGTEIAGHRVRPLTDLGSIVRDEGIRIGIVAVPAPAAQQVADALVASGVAGILNFAPIRLDLADVPVVSVDLTSSLEQLAFQICLGELERE